jgi:hypothetical protein
VISFLCVDGQCINYVCNKWRDSAIVSFSEVYDKLLNGNISFHITHIIKIVTASSSSIACLQ